MRKIKFRGFCKKNNEWIVGYYLQNRGGHFVCPDEFADGKTWEDYEVDPDSVGQWTGLMDECGKCVYEGDIVIVDDMPLKPSRTVVFYEESFCIATEKELEYLRKGEHPYLNDYAHMTCLNEWSNTGLVRVIGNIYENT